MTRQPGPMTRKRKRRSSVVEIGTGPARGKIYTGNNKRDFNWEGNVAYSRYLNSIGIKHEHLLIPDCGHSTQQVYKISGRKLFEFLAPVLRAASH